VEEAVSALRAEAPARFDRDAVEALAGLVAPESARRGRSPVS
jgi:hypothetical protein